MKSKKGIILFWLLLILATMQNVNAQRCGGSTFTFSIYVLNESTIDSLSYEVLPIDDSLLAKIVDFSEKREGMIMRSISDGYIVKFDSLDILRIADFSHKNENLLAEIDKRLNSKIPRKGYIKNGTLEFPTIETYFVPYLLKISDKNQSIYILANLFGGCWKERKIIWGAYPKIVKEIY